MKKLEKIQLGALLVAGFCFRLLAAWGKVFWFDEAISLAFAKQDLSNILTATLADNHPPFYYLFLHFWMKFSQSEFFLRLPSIIFGLISIFLIYLVTEKLFDKKVASVSSLILALSPLHVYFSAETRMYSLWTMLTLAGFYFFLKILSRPKKIYYLIFNILFLISLYTHYFTIFFLLSLDLFLILKRKKYQRIVFGLFFCQVAIGLLFLPWVFYFLSNTHPKPWQITPVLGIPATFLSFILGGVGAVTLKTFFALTTPFLIKTIFSIASIFFILLFFLGMGNKERAEENLLLILLVFFPILATVLISISHPIYSPRPFLAFAPYFYILAARGLESLGKKWPKLIAIVLLSFILFIQNFYPPFKPQTLKEAVKFIKENSPAPPLVVHTDILTFYPFSYYLKEKASQFLVFPSELTRKTTDIIGGSPVSLSEVTEKNRPFWSVHFTWDEKTWKFKKEQPRLEKNHKYDLLKTINDLEIFYYQPRESASLLLNK